MTGAVAKFRPYHWNNTDDFGFFFDGADGKRRSIIFSTNGITFRDEATGINIWSGH